MRERLHVVDEGRTPEIPDLGRKRRTEPWHRATALHRLQHRRLLACDVRAGADHEPERAPFQEPGGTKLLDRLYQPATRGRVLLAEVDEAIGRLRELHRNQHAFEEEMWPELHHVPILDRPGLALVRVDDDVTGAWLAGDCLPLDPGREARSTVSGERRRLELLDDALLRERVADELEPAALLVVRERLVSLPEAERRAVIRTSA